MKRLTRGSATEGATPQTSKGRTQARTRGPQKRSLEGKKVQRLTRWSARVSNSGITGGGEGRSRCTAKVRQMTFETPSPRFFLIIVKFMPRRVVYARLRYYSRRVKAAEAGGRFEQRQQQRKEKGVETGGWKGWLWCGSLRGGHVQLSRRYETQFQPALYGPSQTTTKLRRWPSSSYNVNYIPL